MKAKPNINITTCKRTIELRKWFEKIKYRLLVYVVGIILKFPFHCMVACALLSANEVQGSIWNYFLLYTFTRFPGHWYLDCTFILIDMIFLIINMEHIKFFYLLPNFLSHLPLRQGTPECHPLYLIRSCWKIWRWTRELVSKASFSTALAAARQ